MWRIALEQEKSEEEELEQEKSEEGKSEEGNKRQPKDMLRPEFRDMTLGDAAQKILERYPRPLKTEHVAKMIFDPKNDNECQRAKNSLAAELRRGAKDGRWQKIDKGFFACNLVDMQSPVYSLHPQQPSMFEKINNGSSLDS